MLRIRFKKFFSQKKKKKKGSEEGTNKVRMAENR